MHQYSQSLSEKIAHKYARLFAKKQCYENVFKLVTEVSELKPSSKLCVLFCYIPGAAGFYYRHVFCLYDGMIVEPLLHLNMKEKNLNDIVPIKRMTVKEYSGMILSDGKYDLSDVLRDDEIRAFNNSGISLNPVDLSNLVSSVAKTADEFLLVMHNALSGKGIHVCRPTPAEAMEASDAHFPEMVDEDEELER
jgi:hypothetical protein